MIAKLHELLGWIGQNKAWLFSGVGVAVLVALGNVVRMLSRRRQVKEVRSSPSVELMAAPAPRAARAIPSRPPWHSGSNDRVGVIADAILVRLREADGTMVYLNQIQAETGCSNLELDEATSRLQSAFMIQRFGGYPDETEVVLTPKGRNYVLQSKPKVT
jgi:hypothetical protein